MITPEGTDSESRRPSKKRTGIIIIAAEAIVVGFVSLETLTSPNTAAVEETTTTSTTIQEVEPPVDTENFTVDQIARGEPFEWKSAMWLDDSRGSFSRIWREAVAESVGQPCRIHDLKHTHASWLIAGGEHPKTIQTRLGHSSIQVTMDRCGHLMEGLDDRTADRLDALAAFSGGPGAAQNRPWRGARIERNPRDQG